METRSEPLQPDRLQKQQKQLLGVSAPLLKQPQLLLPQASYSLNPHSHQHQGRYSQQEPTRQQYQESPLGRWQQQQQQQQQQPSPPSLHRHTSLPHGMGPHGIVERDRIGSCPGEGRQALDQTQVCVAVGRNSSKLGVSRPAAADAAAADAAADAAAGSCLSEAAAGVAPRQRVTAASHCGLARKQQKPNLWVRFAWTLDQIIDYGIIFLLIFYQETELIPYPMCCTQYLRTNRYTVYLLAHTQKKLHSLFAYQPVYRISPCSYTEEAACFVEVAVWEHGFGDTALVNCA
jgi:hypothetical protein